MKSYCTGILLATVLAACGSGTASPGTPPVPPEPPQPGPFEVVAAAGDIADCDSNGDELTAAMLDTMPGTVITLGDNAYPSGTAWNFAQCYEPSWGRHKARTRPSPGNHDYVTPNGRAYYEYFGENAGPFGRGYYSFDVGYWHLISLNSEIDHEEASAQIEWLRADLALSQRRCTLAYWHRARFSSSGRSDVDLHTFWDVLYEANADVITVGHDHTFERFGPQSPAARRDDDRGIRQLVVGTGGRATYGFREVQPNSEARVKDRWGLLRLELGDGWYRWKYISTEGELLDSGVDTCH